MGDVGAVTVGELQTRWQDAKRAASGNFRFCLPGVTSVEEVDRPVKKRRVMREQPMTRAEWMAQLNVSEAQVAVISSYVQGTPEWLASRVGRLTASNFGAAAKMNKYSSPRALLKQMLWGEFKGNAATRWGSAHEETARLEYIAVKQQEISSGSNALQSVEVEEVGLMINPERPWMGNSPDGIVVLTYESGAVERGLLEIKCPYKKEFYTPDPVPPHYYAQIQGTMGNLSLPWCDFVVWTPTGLQVTHVDFDATFWDTKLLPALSTFYHDMYVPLALAKENGALDDGCVDMVIEIE
jgi:putative phage-type endonuclease